MVLQVKDILTKSEINKLSDDEIIEQIEREIIKQDKLDDPNDYFQNTNDSPNLKNIEFKKIDDLKHAQVFRYLGKFWRRGYHSVSTIEKNRKNMKVLTITWDLRNVMVAVLNK